MAFNLLKQESLSEDQPVEECQLVENQYMYEFQNDNYNFFSLYSLPKMASVFMYVLTQVNGAFVARCTGQCIVCITESHHKEIIYAIWVW